MVCELVTVAALHVTRAPVAAQSRRVCLHALLREARRQGAVVVELGGRKRVWQYGRESRVIREVLVKEHI